MEIKDLETILTETLEKPEDGELKARYSDAISEFLKDNKSSNDVVSIVIRGVDIDRAVNYFDYIEAAQGNEIPSIWKQIRESKELEENKGCDGIKFLAGLLSSAFMKDSKLTAYQGNVIGKMVSMITDEKKPISTKSYSPVVLDYFVDEVISETTYPKWETFKLDGMTSKAFAEIILEVTASDEDKYRSIRQWGTNGLHLAEDLIEKERIEARIPKSRASDLREIYEHYEAVEKQLRDEVYTVAHLEKKINGLQDEIEKLESEKSDLQGEITTLEGSIEEQKNSLRKAEQEIDERKSINDAFSAVKKNDEEGMLNDIAGELKTVYGQIRSIETKEMTAELGEMYRVLIGKVFNTLNKKGIRME